jgi:hypothetical protein
MKYQIVHTLQKYLLNPPIKLALAMGLPLPDKKQPHPSRPMLRLLRKE